ncbi:DHA2 family efflux MFS transporter permease subunit [Actinomadura sp. NAK00032]|uniref:DHA2 family efflux MFS transporter permease subunit n=1 Tax=Actinomadura sp. NAK00032 TaxID=2742128 RepID=UPI001590DB86|nr:DHA2 family efflux MFS transporter permease subunit [Actinomadura sp. NAK00032]QKW33801.1 DHA2 family efflux MFS transporter permease subunit [Actinomadura sp. NAK00032]
MTTAKDEARDERAMPKGRDLYVILGALMLAMLLAALDQTIVSTALPTIVSDLGGLNHLSWVVTAYLLASTASTPLWGKLGDQYGRKRLFQTSIVIFLIGSALCGLSQDMFELIVFRAIQGLGGGGLMVLVVAIVGDVVPPRERGRYQGLFGAVFGVSSVCGPLLGGWFVDNLSWRWVFYINIPIGIVALIVIAAVLHASGERERHRIDYLGTLLIVGWAVGLVLMTTWGGTQYAWSSAPIIGLAVGSVALIVVWLLVERRAAEPIMPPALLANPVFALGAAISFAVGFAMFGALTFLPIFLQVVHGVSPTLSGVYLLPMMLGMLVSSIGSGQLITHFGRYKIYPVVGTPLIALALWLCSGLSENSSTLSMSLRFALLGFGLGLVLQVLVIAVQNAVSYQDLGSATSGVTFFRQIGGSFGVAVFGSIFSNQLATHVGDLARVLPPGFDPAAVQGNPQLLDRFPGEVKQAVLHAYAQSIDSVFLWAVPVAAAAFVLTWFLREVPLRATSQTHDYGEGFGAAPTVRSSRHEIERALSELMRKDPKAAELYDRLALLCGVDLPAGSVWALCRIAKDGTVGRQELADRAGVTMEHGRPYVDRLVAAGYVERSDTTLAITTSGQAVAERLFAARRAGLARHVDGWAPEEHPELADLLTRLAHASVGDDEDGEILRRPPAAAVREA